MILPESGRVYVCVMLNVLSAPVVGCAGQRCLL